MTDNEIIALYWRRADNAISETDKIYGRFCFTVANSVLSNREDSEESVNDTYLAAWNTIPPTRPDSLKAYLGKLARRIAISRLRFNTSIRRGGGEAHVAMDELAECIQSSQNVENEIMAGELTRMINSFLRTVSVQDRRIFVARYWYVMPVADIARRFGVKQSLVKTSLFRTRGKLKCYLEDNT